MSEASEQSSLAFEYVSGTLRGQERKDFESQLAEGANKQALQKLVAFWEEQLMDLQPFDEKHPSPTVWKQLSAQINVENTRPTTHGKDTLWSRIWQSATPAFAAIALMLAVFIFMPNTQTQPNTDYVAVLTDESGRALVTALTATEDKNMWLKWEIDTLPKGSSAQIWAISKRDGQTRPIAVLANAHVNKVSLDEATWRLITDAEFLVMTEEEPGGSAIDEPSEKLLAKGFCVRFSPS